MHFGLSRGNRLDKAGLLAAETSGVTDGSLVLLALLHVVNATLGNGLFGALRDLASRLNTGLSLERLKAIFGEAALAVKFAALFDAVGLVSVFSGGLLVNGTGLELAVSVLVKGENANSKVEGDVGLALENALNDLVANSTHDRLNGLNGRAADLGN